MKKFNLQQLFKKKRIELYMPIKTIQKTDLKKSVANKVKRNFKYDRTFYNWEKCKTKLVIIIKQLSINLNYIFFC